MEKCLTAFLLVPTATSFNKKCNTPMHTEKQGFFPYFLEDSTHITGQVFYRMDVLSRSLPNCNYTWHM